MMNCRFGNLRMCCQQSRSVIKTIMTNRTQVKLRNALVTDEHVTETEGYKETTYELELASHSSVEVLQELNRLLLSTCSVCEIRTLFTGNL
jgi:uncharacterized Fe-S radical SAM superfamily protein PflX